MIMLEYLPDVILSHWLLDHQIGTLDQVLLLNKVGGLVGGVALTLAVQWFRRRQKRHSD